MHCAIWYHLYNFKKVKSTHGGVLILVKLQAEACNFTKIDTPPWVFVTFFKLYKWYQIAQRTTYAWTGLDETEVAFLNDFRRSKELIAWHELLNLLKGTPCKLSRPKNVFATDLSIPRSNGIPFCATGIKSIEFVGAYDQRMNEIQI